MTEEPAAEKQKRIQHIRNLYAFDLFSQRRFEESLKTFAELGTGDFIVYWICIVKHILNFTFQFHPHLCQKPVFY